MRNLSGKLIVLCYCLFSLLFVTFDATFIAGLFCVVSLSCLMQVFPTRRTIGLLFVLFLAGTVFFPGLCVFLPVLVYDVVRIRLWWFATVAGTVMGIVTLVLTASNWNLFLFLLLGFILSGFLSYQIDSFLKLQETLIHTQDDSKEKNLLLSEKNRHLIETQNQEIYTATLKERNRIAREIHDNVGHMLSRSILLVGVLKTINQQENLTPSITQLDDTLNHAMNNVRQSVHDLHDDSVDLRAAIEEIVSGFTKCRCELDYDMGRLVPNEIKYTFISIVKEALANVMKHSDASLVQIRLREHPGLYQLMIDDNGSCWDSSYATDLAFSPDDAFSAQHGMGLGNMKDRVHNLKGTIQFQKKNGFHIFITIPKEYSIQK